MMKMSINDILTTNKKVEHLKNSFKILKLGELSKDLEEFFDKNLEYFLSKEDIEIELINENGVILTDNDGSSFKILFHPDCVNPSEIVLKLNNLGGCLEQIYTIKFEDERTINVIKTKLSKSSDCSMVDCKARSKQVFVDSKLVYEQKVTNLFSPIVEFSRGGIIETETFYFDKGKTVEVLKSTISHGEENFAYGNQRKFECWIGSSHENAKELDESKFIEKCIEARQLNPMLRMIKKQ